MLFRSTIGDCVKKYLLNISTGTIHNGDNPCYQGKVMAESNKKWFYEYFDAVNFYEGKSKKGIPCCRCLKEKQI